MHYYVSIALKLSEVDEIVGQLENEGMDRLAGWLGANKSKLYGKERDDWMPFMGKSIKELMQSKAELYKSTTLVVDEILKKPEPDFTPIFRKSTNLFFFDFFALQKEAFNILAERLDARCAEGTQGQCCLVMPYALSEETQELMKKAIDKYGERCRSVVNNYRGGCPHRIVMIPEDLENFCECERVFRDLPSHARAKEFENVHPEHTRAGMPPMGESA